jgi:putative transposase
VFLSEELSMIPLQSLSWMREKKTWQIFAFCLMPNHLHLLIKLLNKTPIEKVMGQFHSFSGHKIIDALKKNHATALLNSFMVGGMRKGDRKYLFWEDSLARYVETGHVLVETLEYIHNNPVNKKWHLVDDRSDYQFSSASYYDNEKIPIIPIDDCWESFGETPSS